MDADKSTEPVNITYTEVLVTSSEVHIESAAVAAELPYHP